MEQMKLAVSHDQVSVDPPMTPDEAKAITKELEGLDGPAKMEQFKAIWDNLSGPERETFLGAQQVSGGAPGLSMGLGGSVVGMAKQALKYAPNAGRWAAGGIGATLAGEGANAVGSALGVPRPINNILSMIAAMAGGHAAGGGGKVNPAVMAEESAATKFGVDPNKISTRTMPMTDAEVRSAAPTGKFGVRSQEVRPPDLGPTTKWATGSNVDQHPSFGTTTDTKDFPSMGGGGVNVIPKNLSLKRTPADVSEQVGRGVQNDFRGTAHIDASTPSAPRVGGSPGEKAGTQSLDQLMKALNSKVKGNGTSNDRSTRTPRPPEYPNGTNAKTPPNVYEQAQKDWAESHANYDAFEAAQTKIREALDRGGAADHSRKSKLKSKVK